MIKYYNNLIQFSIIFTTMSNFSVPYDLIEFLPEYLNEKLNIERALILVPEDLIFRYQTYFNTYPALPTPDANSDELANISSQYKKLLTKFLNSKKNFKFASFAAAFIKINRNFSIDIKIGDNLKQDEFLNLLIEFGWKKNDIYPTQNFSFTKRHSSVDLKFEDTIYRVGFFDDEIDFIAVLDENTFTAVKKLKKLKIPKLNFNIFQSEDFLYKNFDSVILWGKREDFDEEVYNYWFKHFDINFNYKILNFTTAVDSDFLPTQETEGIEKSIGLNWKYKKREITFIKAKRKVIKNKNQEELLTLKSGDIVVHTDYGIGIFRKIVQEGSRDYFLIEYPDESKLYVPIERADRISKYWIPDEYKDNFKFLYANAWKKRLKKIKEDIFKYAKTLIQIYAKRQLVKKEPLKYFPDEELFKEEFEFILTSDQEKAINEIKADLESDKPMDRILVGDVGFGKTEVIMQTAFKVVINGKQVAVLVPTTILAWQHFNTFSKRFENHPINIEMLTSNTSAKKKREIIQKLQEGKIDIIIGTSSLLSPKISFKNLGLFVIDEEHKFGVSFKEKMKKLYPNVDVLYVSATPIPRTLQMGLSGIRDISLISQAPINRKPIRNFIYPYKREKLRQAIEFELNRGGKVFLVAPTIKELDFWITEIKKVIPQARVVKAHGRSRDTEKKVWQLINDEADILVSTTIIDSGIDIPIANTMIVVNANRFGLSQLYQLRGRVGRSNTQAFAYFFYPGDKAITQNARQRLQAIKEMFGLGGGFQLALKDLYIRGAGNILGKQQHGHIMAIGFNLYNKLLKEAVEKLKSNKNYKLAQIEILDNYMIPNNLIKDAGERIYWYQKITDASTIEELDKIYEEIKNIYLPNAISLPTELENFIEAFKIRIVLKEKNIELLKFIDQSLEVYPSKDTDHEFLMNLIKKFDCKATPTYIKVKLTKSIKGFSLLIKNLI